MLNVWATVTLVSALCSWLFGQEFPLWGPAFYAATATAAVWAAFWYCNGSWGQLVVLPSVCGSILTWYALRFYDSGDSYTEIGVVDLLALLSVSVVSYYVGVVGLARRRRGDSLTTSDVSLTQWLARQER